MIVGPDLTRLFVSPGQPLKDGIRVIQQGAHQVALVVESDLRLVGTLTDGDVRRGLLRGESLDQPIERTMRRDFRSVSDEASQEDAAALMRRESLHQVPSVDSAGRVTRLFTLEEFLRPRQRQNWVVIMAGGQGKRLLPLTESSPKPMLPVAGRPMLEIMLERCVDAGLRTVFISVNYKKEQIQTHFGDGSRWGADVRYLEEDQALGTAGSLALLPEPAPAPILVMNGDVLTRIDLTGLLRFHAEHGASATICVHPYETQIPFGVIDKDGTQVVGLDEKPILTHHVNAGIYMIDPGLLGLLRASETCDMPQLLRRAISHGKSVTAFPIHEYWLDVGDPAMLDRANGEWH